MKKLLALLMIAGMSLSSSAFAAEIPAETNVKVPTTIVMKKSADTDWVSGPIQIWSSMAKDFDFRAKIDMSEVKAAYDKLVADAKTWATDKGISEASAIKTIEDTVVTGSFKVEIEYPDTIVIPAEFSGANNMSGFAFENGGNVTDVYAETSRVADANKLTIDVKVKDGLKIKELNLDNLTLTCEKVKVNSDAIADYTINGKITGETSATAAGITSKVVYNFNDTSATVKIVDSSSSGGSSSGSSSRTVTIKFETGDSNIKIDAVSSKGKVEINFDTITVPTVEGKEFGGFYADSAFTQPLTGKKTFTTSTTIYTKWTDKGTEPVNPDQPDQPIFTDNHIAYIIGYPEGTVKPEDNISREEVATVFYRLLRAEKQIEIASTENRFSDVDESRWSNKAISSMAKGGYISGYESGTFKPEQFITRSEFVTIIANMYKLDKTPATTFSDVTNGYWASGYIGAISGKGWVNGYEDGTFRPEQFITRAEVMATVNRMLGRKVSADGISADAKIWSDISASDWYYLDVVEATNAHEYTKAEGAEAETWTKVVDNNVWAEKAAFEDAE